MPVGQQYRPSLLIFDVVRFRNRNQLVPDLIFQIEKSIAGIVRLFKSFSSTFGQSNSDSSTCTGSTSAGSDDSNSSVSTFKGVFSMVGTEIFILYLSFIVIKFDRSLVRNFDTFYLVDLFAHILVYC